LYTIYEEDTASRPALGPTQPPTQWVQGAVSLGVKRLEREADHSPPSNAEVKNEWSYTSTLRHAYMAWCSVKNKGDNFTLTINIISFLETILGMAYIYIYICGILSFETYIYV
jgi:hypothetical protein